MGEFEIGFLFGPPIVWVPVAATHKHDTFSGVSLTWLFVAIILRYYPPESRKALDKVKGVSK